MVLHTFILGELQNLLRENTLQDLSEGKKKDLFFPYVVIRGLETYKLDLKV